jgi:hypothetical protein
MTIQNETVPKARATDPQTSWDAAESVRNVTDTQAAILMLLRATPMCDEKLIAEYRRWERIDNYPAASDQGIRSRRAELVRLGLVIAAPYKELMSTNRYGQAWQVVR